MTVNNHPEPISRQISAQNLVVAAFYHFTSLHDYQEIQNVLEEFCDRHQLKGTILLAPEGINSTIAGSREGIDALLNFLRSDPRLHTLEHKESYCEQIPFQRMKVRLKTEIVKLGLPALNPNQIVGTYIEPQDWNALISDPSVIVIDTRNIYEVEIGTFNGAVNPNLESFSEFPQYIDNQIENQIEEQNLNLDRKVAMFCTGGIRCEKASAYMMSLGFAEVYHLKGGILKYLEEIPRDRSLWQGKCFVFDDRRSVDHNTFQSES